MVLLLWVLLILSCTFLVARVLLPACLTEWMCCANVGANIPGAGCLLVGGNLAANVGGSAWRALGALPVLLALTVG